MSSSSWPPQLKAWVQDCLSKATPSNRSAVQAELKTVLWKAHADGAMEKTDWSKVELQALKAQNLRTTHIPQPAPAPPPIRAPQIIPPPLIVPSLSYHTAYPPLPSAGSSSIPSYPINNGNALNGHSLGGHTIQPAVSSLAVPTPTEGKKKKKRKSSDASSKPFPTPYHFTSTAESEALARRAARFATSSSSSTPAPPNGSLGMSDWFDPDEVGTGRGSGGGMGSAGLVPGAGVGGKKRMRGKGGLGYGGEEVIEVDPNVMDWDHFTIKGTSTKLEKSYLRLTSEPSPADIRPLPILKQTLQLLKSKWKENHNYAYAVDQFKSMRQDLTVQRIKNDFTVEVYEIHARIALEAKDLGEYNQCQSMLRQLYELGIKGHPQEFLSYRIIYLLHTRNRSDMASLLAQLTSTEKSDPAIHHALQVHASLATSNYAKFFRLFTTAPNMSGYIMDHFVEKERMSALAVMSKAYITLPLTYLTSLLAFDSDSETDSFLTSHDSAIYTNPTLAPTSNSTSTMSLTNPAIKSAWKPIQRPKPTPLNQLVWDAKKAAGAVGKGLEKYRVVDLKGQVH